MYATKIALTFSALFAAVTAQTIKNLVAFGDSYTDQSRLNWFNSDHSFPPKDYKQVYPPSVKAADGGTSWVRYAEMYGTLKSSNYAVAGAACSNFLTGRANKGPAVYPHAYFPSVLEYEIPAFVQDHITNKTSNGKKTFTNDLSASETAYSLWIGTNDVGYGALLTGNQTAGVTINNVISCTIEWMQQMYTFGARNFIFQNMLPLQLTPLYGNIPGPLTRYWPYPHNITQYSIEMSKIVASGNELWSSMVPNAVAKLEGAKAVNFDSYSLFHDIYTNPSHFLNGTKPLNVTGYVAVSDINGQNTVVAPNPDSFLWYDALHPSEEASRIVAREMVNTLKGNSKYATFHGGVF